MKQYRLWVRLNQTQTANTIVYADNAYTAKQLGEAQYGVGNVLSYTEVEG
jgi:hypothetical protein